jgi:hypothetical protein
MLGSLASAGPPARPQGCCNRDVVDLVTRYIYIYITPVQCLSRLLGITDQNSSVSGAPYQPK